MEEIRDRLRHQLGTIGGGGGLYRLGIIKHPKQQFQKIKSTSSFVSLYLNSRSLSDLKQLAAKS